MNKSLVAVVSLFGLASCGDMPAQEPIVSAFNGDSVNIIQPLFAAMTEDQLLAKANSICQRGNKKVAERVSQRSLPDYGGTEYLYLCLSK